MKKCVQGLPFLAILVLLLSCDVSVIYKQNEGPPASDAESSTEKSLSATFTNPIKTNRSGDPCMYKAVDGTYYETNTEGLSNNFRITLRKATAPYLIAYGEQKTVYWVNASAKDVWAPELFQYNGIWYIYYAKTDTSAAGRRMHVIKCADIDPLNGTWSYAGQVNDPTNLFAIDGMVFESDGQLYMTWSGWASASDTAQRIYLATMSNPYTVNSARTCISSPTAAWEKHNVPINEGPFAWVKNGNVYVTFSASQANTDFYCLGLLTASQSGNLLSASSWTKTGPVFQQSASVHGTGGNSIVKSPDGTEDWLVYHAFNVSGQASDQRDLCMKKITWSGSVPQFGTPPAYGAALSLPSGSTIRFDAYQAENATVSGAVKYTTANAGDYNGFTGTGYVKYVNNAGDSVAFAITAAAAGTYNLLFRYTNDTASARTLKLTVNGTVSNNAMPFPSTNNGNDAQGLRFCNYKRSTQWVTLKAGSNSIKLETNGTNGPWIDCLLVTN